jgi:hypothetical protein
VSLFRFDGPKYIYFKLKKKGFSFAENKENPEELFEDSHVGNLYLFNYF